MNLSLVLSVPELLVLLTLFLLLTASAFFSGSETALFSLGPHQRLQMRRSRTLAGTTIDSLLANPRAILITLLVTNTTVNVAYFVISTVLLMQLRDRYDFGALMMIALSVLPVVVLILFGELLPKLLAARLSREWSRVFAVPLMVVHRTLAPLRVVFSALIITPLSRLLAPTIKPPALSAGELESILEHSRQRGVIDDDEEQMLQQVLELSQLKVRDLMVPRVDVLAFESAGDPAQLLALVHRCRQSRIPIYHKHLDQIEGMILTRQLLLKPPQSTKALRRLIRQVVYVPELMRADQLLVHFRKTGTTFAIAVDEYGGTAGLITLEDVVEHMVGDIAGSHEQTQEPQVQPLEPGRWRVSANLPIHEWVDAFGQYPAMAAISGSDAVSKTGVSTLGGLVMARLGRLPVEGDHITIGNVVIEVDQMVGRRIQWLALRLVAPSTADEFAKIEKTNA